VLWGALCHGCLSSLALPGLYGYIWHVAGRQAASPVQADIVILTSVPSNESRRRYSLVAGVLVLKSVR
jgi:hypothetical protein